MDQIESSNFWNKISKGYFPFLIIGVLVFVTYIRVFNFGFSGLDDKLLLISNFTFLSDISNIPDAFLTDAFIKNLNSPFYRPLQTVSFILDSQLIGSKPETTIFHITNLIIHIVNAMLVFVLLRKVQKNDIIALILALLYSVNPLFVHTVAWIPARGDLLVFAFIVSSFIYWINYLESGAKKDIYLCSLLLLLSLFSKEVAALTPVLFIAYYYISKKSSFNLKLLVFPIILWLAITVFYFIVRANAIHSNFSSDLFNFDNLIQNLATVFEFISKFVIGFNLSPMPDYNTMVTFTGFIILAGISVYLYFYRTIDFKPIFFGILWIFVFLFPTLMFKHGLGDFSYKYLEHRAYLPMLGFLVILVPLLNNLFENDKTNRKKQILLIIIALYSLHTYAYSDTYQNYLNLYTRVIKTNPKSAMAYYNRGVNLRIDNKINEAFADINKAVEIYPDYIDALADRGLLMQNSGNVNQALLDYERVLKFTPNNYQVLNSLGIIYGMKSKFPESVQMLTRCIQINPNMPAAYNNRGYALSMSNRLDEAMIDFNMALKISPNFADAYHNRGNLKFNIGDKDGACQDWNMAVKGGNKSALNNFEKYCK